MFRVFKAELYKASRNLFFYALLVIIILLSVLMTGFGGAGSDAHRVLVFDISINDEYTEAIQAVRDQDYYARYDRINEKYMIATEAAPLLQPGGALHNRYGWLLEQEYTYQQFIEDTYYPAEVEHVNEIWKFDRILKDNAAIMLLGVIFAVFFFGQDFTRRGYSAYLFAGRSRIQIIAGKYCAYLVVSTLLALVMFVVAILTIVPNVMVLGTDYVLRSVAIRLVIDVGLLSLPVIFPFIFRDVIKSMAAAFLFIILFFSNRAIVELPLLDSYFNDALWQLSFSLPAFFPLLLTTVAIFVVASAGSYLLFRRTQLR